jgi:hypothetical protein
MKMLWMRHEAFILEVGIGFGSGVLFKIEVHVAFWGVRLYALGR